MRYPLRRHPDTPVYSCSTPKTLISLYSNKKAEFVYPRVFLTTVQFQHASGHFYDHLYADSDVISHDLYRVS